MAKFVIDWRIEGSWEVEARTAEEAQDKFDATWGTPGRLDWQSGEVSNDDPVRVDAQAARRQKAPRP